MATIDKRSLKLFIRFDGSGRAIPGSTVWRKKMPKVGKWAELTGYQCCNYSSTTTTTTTTPT